MQSSLMAKLPYLPPFRTGVPSWSLKCGDGGAGSKGKEGRVGRREVRWGEQRVWNWNLALVTSG